MNVSSQEQFDPSTPLKLYNTDSRLKKLIHGGSKQFVARMTVKNGLQFLPVVPVWGEPGTRQDLGDLTPQDRDGGRARVIRLTGKEANDASLANNLPVRRKGLCSNHVVRARPMHDAFELGLGEEQDVGGSPLV